MKLFHPFFRFVFALFFLQSAQAQSVLITYESPDALSVCNADTFFITIRNLSAQTASNGNLTINLPNGLQYSTGTVAGATETNISNLQSPVFSFPNIAAGALQIIQIQVNADCQAAKALDAGGLFVANLNVQTSAGNAQAITTSIKVETGLILIESVDPQFASGERFDTILRKICVVNTRIGPISKLFFEDTHASGLEISINGAQNINQTTSLFQSEFSGSFLTTTGDGDNLLELGEKLCFIEKIVITDCGIPEFNNQSLLRVGWGCTDSYCRYDSLLSGIEIKESTRIPNLKMKPFWNPPADYCASTASTAGFKIKNIGAGNATNVLMRIKVQEKDFVGIDPASLRLSMPNLPAIPLTPSVVLPKSLGDCNVSYGSDITFIIPQVAARDSVVFTFDYYNCSGACKEILPTFTVDYFYQKPCPPNGFVSDGLIIGPELAYLLRQNVKLSVNGCFQEGGTYPFLYKIESKRLTEAKGVLEIVMDLPNGLTLSNDCPLQMGGVNPSNVTLTPVPNQPLTTLNIQYPLPLAANIDYLTFCLTYNCDTTTYCVADTAYSSQNGQVIQFDPSGSCNNTCVTPLRIQTNWLPNANAASKCGASTCDALFLSLNQGCATNDGDDESFDTTVTYDTFPVQYFWKMDAYRLNYDLPDVDNNRIADGPGHASGTQVARRRYLPGDTMRVEFRVYVDSGQGLKGFPRSVINIVPKSDIHLNGTDSFNIFSAKNIFTNANLFRFLSDSVRVRYANGDSYKARYNGPAFVFDKSYLVLQQVNAYPTVILDELCYFSNTTNIRLDTLYNRGLLPKPAIGKGDSLFVYADFVLDFNFVPPSDNTPNPPLVGFQTRADNLGLGYSANNTQTGVHQQYSGFKTSWTNSAYSLKPCQNSFQSKPFDFRLRIARGNMFPYEVRPLARISKYYQTKPYPANVVNALVRYLALQDSVNIISNKFLPFTQTQGTFTLDFANTFSNPPDEGFFLSTDVTFGPDCQFAKPDSSVQYLELTFKPGFSHPDTLKENKDNTLGFFSNQPKLQIQSNDTIVYVTQKAFKLDFLIRNAVASPAPNMWIKVVSPSGNANNFGLFQLPQVQAIPNQSGIFQVPSLSAFGSSNYRITGLSNSCVSDSLLIIYGWNCTPVTAASQDICGIDSFWVVLRKESPEIELAIKAEPASINICEVSDYYEVQVYNAKTGYAYDLDVSVSLPPGLEIVPGSCQISYPLGSPYVALTNPAFLMGLYRWDINAVQALIAANGLPGVDQAPNNAFKIRFKTLAACGFVANSQPIFGAGGVDPCGSATNTLNKPASPLTVNGLNPSYGVIMELKPVPPNMLYCGGTQQYTVRATLLGKPSNKDSIYVLLPAHLQYVSGSYTAGQNAAAGPPTLTLQGFRVAIPANLNNGSVLEFTYSVNFQTGAGCGDDLMVVQSRVSTEALCVSLGTTCTVYFATGEAILPIQIEHPQLNLVDAKLFGTGTGYDLKISVRNVGQVLSKLVQFHLYYDTNGNGVPDAGEQLIASGANNGILQPNEVLNTSFPFIDASSLPSLCNLLIVLPADENCTCADVVFKLNNLPIYLQNVQICENKPLSVGISAQSGATYAWEVSGGSVDCTTCATAMFTPPLGAPLGSTFDLILHEYSSGCQREFHFTYTFGFPFALKPNNQTLCKGKTLELSITPTGAMYNWSGPGIVNPASQTQSLSATQSATYAVTVTLPNGCTADTSVFITVLPSDTVQLPPIQTCQGVPVNILGQTTAQAGLYKLVKQKSNGCDSLVLQQLIVKPGAQTLETLSFCKGDTLKVYDQLFIQAGGQICKTAPGANGCDSTHCVQVTAYDPPMIASPDTIYGQILQNINLLGAAGYQQYLWTPVVPNCANCPAINVQFDTAGFYEYTLIIGDGNQCVDTVVYRIVVFPPCNPKNVRIPNAFTPNGDGLNETFKVVDREGSEVVGGIAIYDRWGEKVYASQNKLFWDGTIDGKPAPTDVYVYIIEIICAGTPEKLVGDVTLLR